MCLNCIDLKPSYCLFERLLNIIKSIDLILCYDDEYDHILHIKQLYSLDILIPH